MPSETMLSCGDLTEDLAGTDEPTLLTGAARQHIQQCLRCQAEMAQYRRLRRTLRGIADQPVSCPESLEHDILVALDHEDGRLIHRVPGRAAATIGGLAAAAAGMIALAARQRRGTRLAS